MLRAQPVKEGDRLDVDRTRWQTNFACDLVEGGAPLCFKDGRQVKTGGPTALLCWLWW